MKFLSFKMLGQRRTEFDDLPECQPGALITLEFGRTHGKQGHLLSS